MTDHSSRQPHHPLAHAVRLGLKSARMASLPLLLSAPALATGLPDWAEYPPEFPLVDLTAESGFVITGGGYPDGRSHELGRHVASAGDINGDGLDDILVGGSYITPNYDYSGQSYVIFGSSEGFEFDMVLRDGQGNDFLDGTNGFVIKTSGSPYGIPRVAGGGDFNGDGFDDVVISEYGAMVDGKEYAGEVYMILGQGSAYPPVTDGPNFEGLQSMRITSSLGERFEYLGQTVDFIGDFNGDGIDDLLVSSGRYDAAVDGVFGGAYIIFGDPDLTSSLDVMALDGSDGFFFSAPGLGGGGKSVRASGVGDFNGDGFDDVILCGTNANNDEGRAVVLFGSDRAFSAMTKEADLDAAQLIEIVDPTSDYTGTSCDGAGDINGDGLEDLIIGANDSVGEAFVVLGTDQAISSPLSLADLNGVNGTRIFESDVPTGADSIGHPNAFATGVGDVNADGFDDLAISSGNLGAGRTFVVYGAPQLPDIVDLSQAGGMVGPEFLGDIDTSVDAFDDVGSQGRAIAALGDVNGDGGQDFIIGARASDTEVSRVGKAVVLYGQSPVEPLPVPGSNNWWLALMGLVLSWGAFRWFGRQ